MPYWRAAGMTYVGYANACAVLVRKCMKEPFKSQTATREKVHFKLSQWLDGVAQQAIVRTSNGGGDGGGVGKK
ncbi:hypothetical protein CY35_04G050400 [Sphagnum magellanicum]|nr:hypothetical protein CY35_04G050400 [Sphagnum magellanicum]